MNLLEAVARTVSRPLARSIALVPTNSDIWGGLFSFDGLPHLQTTMQPNKEADITGEFLSLVQGAYMGNGVAFACMMTRYMLFSEVSFQFQQYRKGLPGPLFGTPALSILDHPEKGKTTGDMLARALLDADIDGNWFGVRRAGGKIKRIRPDWTTIIVGSPNSDMGSWDPDAEFIGLAYEPGGPNRGNPPKFFLAEEVAHFAPIPDPLFSYRGMSWLVPIIREVMGDSAASTQKLAFFRNAMTPNIAITLPSAMSVEKAREWVALLEQEHAGVSNAYKTMYFGGGAEANVIGSSFNDADFRGLQGVFETRIAAASGMHPVLVPFSEGLTGSSLNAGNFQQAARLVADKTLRPLWRNMAGSLETLVPPPNSAAKLWYNEDQVAFLRTDVKDAAEIQQTYASTINALTVNGFTPESAIDATVSGDMNRLVPTGLLSVQLQPPGTTLTPRSEFWSTHPWLAGFGDVSPEMRFAPDHPLVAAYPDMFEVSKPYTIMSGEVRCDGCNRLLAEAAPGGFQGTCPRCKVITIRSAPPDVRPVITYERKAAWTAPTRDVTPAA